MKKIFYLSTLLISFNAHAQRTVGLIQHDVPNTDGYVLFAPIPSNQTYLINKCGYEIHEWTSTHHPALAAYLMDDGSLIRSGNLNNTYFASGGAGGILEKYDWNGALTWSYTISDSTQVMHHDFTTMPNGNILALVWENRTAADAIANGKDSTYANAHLLSERITEIQPTGATSGNIVWEWKAWDHLIQDYNAAKANYGDVSLHPELLNINYFSGPPASDDWIHLNSVDYNAALDQILVSAHNFGEVWILDHSTTTAQAASHAGGYSGKGGDLMYRWGNPRAYKQGTNSDQVFFGQHHATWIPQGVPDAGKILVFNNGTNRPAGNYSSVDMFETPIDANNNYPLGAATSFLPDSLSWSYTAVIPTSFYATNISGAYSQPNGNFVITSGPSGTIFEIDANKNTVWKYISPVNSTGILAQGATPTNNTLFKGVFYPPTFAGFSGITLARGNEIELNPIAPSICDSLFSSVNTITEESNFSIYPNQVGDKLYLNCSQLYGDGVVIEIYNSLGENVYRNSSTGEKSFAPTSCLTSGIYFLKITSGNNSFSKMFVKE